MRSNRFKLIVGVVFVLGVITILFFSQYGKKNFVNAFIINPNKFEETIDNIAIWEITEHKSESILIINKGEELYDKARTVLTNWEVKKDLSKNLNATNTMYKIVLTNNEHPTKPITILVNEDGMINIHRKEYKFVKGNLDDLLNLKNENL